MKMKTHTVVNVRPKAKDESKSEQKSRRKQNGRKDEM